jgi:predicted heme/steroid binding protein
VVYGSKIYDVSDNAKWKDGRHFGTHSAGTDLTEALGGAPHGAEALEKLRYVGKISKKPGIVPRSTPAHKVFIVMSYINLAIIFLILGSIRVWRWGLPIPWP